jgi:sulfane dehydrogenase subunit SoxC
MRRAIFNRRAAFIAQNGTNALFHYSAQQTWAVDESGRVRNVLG